MLRPLPPTPTRLVVTGIVSRMENSKSRSWRAGTLPLAELRAVIDQSSRATFAGQSLRKVAERMIKQAENGDDLAVDFVVHDGNVTIEESLDTGARPFLGLVVVRGNLTVGGLFQTTLDPDSVVIVTGNLKAGRLISSGFLEVGGSVTVQNEALWLDNDGCAEIFGDLQMGVSYTQYHAVKVHGRVACPFAFGDHPRFESPEKYPFMKDTDEQYKQVLRARLPTEVLEIVGDPSDDDDWCIDETHADVLLKLVRAGTRVLTPSAAQGS